MSILEYFPGTPRPVQIQILREVERHWNDHDVIVIQASVAAGKSRVAMAIANWQHAVNNLATHISTPTNVLVNQYSAEFPELATLHRQDSYKCFRSLENTCKSMKLKKNLGHNCHGCTYLKAKREFNSKPVSISNVHLYRAHRHYKPILIADEAHTLIQFLREANCQKKWKHDIHYPDGLTTYDQLVQWFKDNNFNQLMEQMGFDGEPKFLIQPGREQFGRKKEWRDCLKFLPVDVTGSKPILWPPSVTKKIVLMSATISRKDIEYLGLAGKRVAYVSATSPISAERRPVIFAPVGSLSVAAQDETVPLLAARIRQYLAKHPGQKGLIHATYSLAAKLRAELHEEPRLMWHTKSSAKSQYQAFRNSRPEDGAVLVASGLYEGVDLPMDAGRWQVIAKVPWPSLGNPVLRHLTELDPDYYTWETLKIVLQASGRICRRPDDFGVTYIVDSSFRRLHTEGRDLMPQYFIDSLRGI
jgi:Rad3-related DNA helicase